MSNTIQKLFSKIIAFILAVITSLAGGDAAKSPEISVKNDVDIATTIIQIEVKNNTSDSYVTLGDFTLEKKEGENWVKMDFLSSFEPSSIAYIVNKRQTVILSIDILNAFGSTLNAGQYRVSKELILSENYSKAIEEIENTKFNSDEAKAKFTQEIMAKVDKVICSAEFTVSSL